MGPRLLAALPALVVLSASGRALAWQESHQVGDDAEIRVGTSGAADVERRVKWHVVRGPLKSVDLVNVDASAVVEPDVIISAEDGRSLTAHALRHDERTVRISVDEPRAIMRGTFTFAVRWHEDLVAARVLARDGGSWRLALSAPVASDAFDGSRTVFELPAAPEPPVAIVADTGAVDDAAVATLRRDPGSTSSSSCAPTSGGERRRSGRCASTRARSSRQAGHRPGRPPSCKRRPSPTACAPSPSASFSGRSP